MFDLKFKKKEKSPRKESQKKSDVGQLDEDFDLLGAELVDHENGLVLKSKQKEKNG